MSIREIKKTSCWTNRSRLELILIVAVLIAVLIAVIFLIFVIKKTPHTDHARFSPDICHTATCINEAAKIIQRIDPNVNPCEDFYQFACGNFLKSAHGNEKLNMIYKMREQRKLQLLEMYAEDFRDDEHKMVKSAKNLFQKCMNETEIEKDNLATIKGALNEIGGWPVLAGFNWTNEANFDWLRATYKLRELGYPFSIFLDLEVQEDTEKPGKYIFAVKPPNFSESFLSKYSKPQAVEIMTEIAIVFGAADREFAKKQMDGTYRFWKHLESYDFSVDKNRLTVGDFQRKVGNAFDWLEFINKIAGPTVQTSLNNYAVFQNEKGLRELADLLFKTPKRALLPEAFLSVSSLKRYEAFLSNFRTVANYMIWKVIEEQLPYLTRNIRELDTKKDEQESSDETRAEFCLKEVEKRFLLSPIETMCNRKYLPVEKRRQVEKILLHIKSKFVDMLKKANWMEERDKRITVAKAETISIVVGQPGNHFDNKILDALDVDVVETKMDTFLSFLTQANRNHQSSLYNQINKSTSENLFNNSLIQDVFDFSIYDENHNVIFVPAIATQGYIFEENRPNYLNYGLMGMSFGAMLGTFETDFEFDGKRIEKWSNETRKAAEKKNQCLMKDMVECNPSEETFQVTFATKQIIGEQVSYAAYDKLVEGNGEQNLIGCDYTPRQLFWISATYCHPTYIYSKLDSYFGRDSMLFSNVACGARRNNLNFAKDFNCPIGSRMNPPKKCEML